LAFGAGWCVDRHFAHAPLTQVLAVAVVPGNKPAHQQDGGHQLSDAHE
jgi:hypothetical protein